MIDTDKADAYGAQLAKEMFEEELRRRGGKITWPARVMRAEASQVKSYSYEEARKHGKIEWEAYVRFGVDQNGVVPRDDLHAWVALKYGTGTAAAVFPLED